jgi:riboflavin synthase
VDSVGVVQSRREDARSVRFDIEMPGGLVHYIARKGSICVDGVSLTVNAVEAQSFQVNIIPHTLEHTNMRDYRTGTRVNLEVDVIARYLERLLSARLPVK